LSEPLKLPAQKQSEIVKAVKHVLDLARSGRVLAIGYAVMILDDDGDVAAGTNAVWTDNVQVREALKTAMTTLNKRVGAKSAIILQ
jgi:predicted NBD/HSP70 family sugar kinase